MDTKLLYIHPDGEAFMLGENQIGCVVDKDEKIASLAITEEDLDNNEIEGEDAEFIRSNRPAIEAWVRGLGYSIEEED